MTLRFPWVKTVWTLVLSPLVLTFRNGAVVFSSTTPVVWGDVVSPVTVLMLSVMMRGSVLSLCWRVLVLGQPGTPTSGVAPATIYFLPESYGRQCRVLSGLSETTTLVMFCVTRLEVTLFDVTCRPDRMLLLCRSTLRILVRPTSRFVLRVVPLTMAVTERTFRFFMFESTTLPPTSALPPVGRRLPLCPPWLCARCC